METGYTVLIRVTPLLYEMIGYNGAKNKALVRYVRRVSRLSRGSAGRERSTVHYPYRETDDEKRVRRGSLKIEGGYEKSKQGKKHGSH